MRSTTRISMKRLYCFVLLTLLSGPCFGGTLVQFRTVLGDVDVELYDQDKPVTVQNFIRYIQRLRLSAEHAMTTPESPRCESPRCCAIVRSQASRL